MKSSITANVYCVITSYIKLIRPTRNGKNTKDS